MKLTGCQASVARHMLGLPNAHRRSYRNRFCAARSSQDYHTCRELVDLGAAMRIPWGWSMGDFFYLTPAGARAALMRGERLDAEDFPREAAAWASSPEI